MSTMPWTARGQYCGYCTSYLSSGNLVRHLDTCARFDGRFSADMSKAAFESEQKHMANYTKKYVLSGSEVNDIAGEFVGHKLTISMVKMILEKAGHRIVDAAESVNKILVSSGMEAGKCSNTEVMGNSMHVAKAGILDPAADITFNQGQTRKEELLPDYTGTADVNGTNSERRAGKRVHVLQK